MKATRIFVSYRRQDSPGFAGRIADHLERHFGRDGIFRDVETIEYGSDFIEAIDSALDLCTALVVVIGPSWLKITDAHGEERLHRKDDFVRLEIAKALSRGILVVPVLVQGARPPAPGELPSELQPLARRQAITVNDDRFSDDMLRLIRALASDMSSLSPVTREVRSGALPAAPITGLRWRTPIWIATGALALGATGYTFFQLGGIRGSAVTASVPPSIAPAAAASGAVMTEPGLAETPRVEIDDHRAPIPVTPAPRSSSHVVRAKRTSAQTSSLKPPSPGTPDAARVTLLENAPNLAAASRPREPVPPPWQPLRMPGSIFGSIFNAPTRERRATMMHAGPPYRSVTAARRALGQRLISQQTYDDTLWVLAEWRTHEIDEARRQRKTMLLSDAQYTARIASIEAMYRGQ
jgi:hypothetical protein